MNLNINFLIQYKYEAIPNRYNFTEKEIMLLISQLQKPFILIGDFNRHSYVWDSNKKYYTEEIIENLLYDQNLFL